MSDTITVLMPVFNRVEYIPSAISSIQKQTYNNVKLLIYDDGSDKKTKSYLTSIKSDDIKIISSERNQGVAHARNVLLDECKTKLAAWMDSDDISNVHRFKYQLSALSTSNLVYTSFERLMAATDTTNIPHKLAIPSAANASALFVVDKSITFDESLPIGEDTDWRSKMRGLHGELVLPNILYYIRFHHNRLGVLYKKH